MKRQPLAQYHATKFKEATVSVVTNHNNMRLRALQCGLLLYFFFLFHCSHPQACPNEKACFFINVEQKGVKLAFYFAVWHLFKISANSADYASFI